MIKALIAFILALVLGACDYIPQPPPTTNPTPPSYEHVVWGDSLLWQALSYGPADQMDTNGREWHHRPGMGMNELKGEIMNSLAHHPDVITLALGTNDAGTWGGRDGWNAQDEASWTEVLANTDGAKVVIVLPFVQVGNDVTQADVDHVANARWWMIHQPNVTIVDWRDYVSPGVLDPGGIHVSSGNEGVRYHATVAGDPL